MCDPLEYTETRFYVLLKSIVVLRLGFFVSGKNETILMSSTEPPHDVSICFISCVCLTTERHQLLREISGLNIFSWDSSSGDNKCLYKISRQTIQYLMRYFSLKQSGGPNDRHICTLKKNVQNLTRRKAVNQGLLRPTRQRVQSLISVTSTGSISLVINASLNYVSVRRMHRVREEQYFMCHEFGKTLIDPPNF